MVIDLNGGGKVLIATLLPIKSRTWEMGMRLQLWNLGKKEVAVLTLLKVYLHIIKPCIPLVLEGNLYIDVWSVLYKPKWKKQLNK